MMNVVMRRSFEFSDVEFKSELVSETKCVSYCAGRGTAARMRCDGQALRGWLPADDSSRKIC